ncbi:cytochrome P450 [Stereum hirsutum FP-91666 SS1]|uniref:cytochrome P450 n=1 Tax=Stereum hirsutum (strain FP-91666) TaxID=721885 RepID=UPI000444A347|nr:cytochrome P450 [Stereum hirsutum FP-91666 SS1]EIM84217.1 cytochrome P450 [Stereum hirsutum FP-91666 SS1]
MMSFLSIVSSVFLSIVLVLILHRQARAKLPPGPRALPCIGNLFQMPRHDVARSFTRWKDIYGDIFYLHVLGREFIILNSAKHVLELFDQRGAFYSDRPHLVMAGDLVGKNKAVLFHPYGEELKRHRKLLRNALEPRRCREYWTMIDTEMRKLMVSMLECPEDFAAHIRRNAGAITLRLAYGYQVPSGSGDDRFITLAEELARITGEATKPGRWLVDSLPWLRYMPSFLPGAGFKRWAQSARKTIEEFSFAPYDFAKTRVASGEALPSFVTESIELLTAETAAPLSKEDDELLMWTAASIYSGGTDTEVATGTAFVLYMALYPDIQRKAQLEIDTVVGRDRLPTMEDKPHLPYVEALLKEIYRFNPVAPLIPHTTLTEDSYQGYRIPKGSWIMANTWALMHDPDIFPSPHRFWPERFLGTDDCCLADPRDYAFGFGRRRCPGITVAETTLFLMVTSILSIFSISPREGDRALEELRSVRFKDGHIS